MPGTIVVGVDGSAASRAALRWAAQEAGLRGARLVAVHAWAFVPVTPIGDPGMIPMPAVDFPGQLEAEQRAAHADFDTAIAEALGTELEIETRLVEGEAGDALMSESAGADLVVVGSHGRSGIKAALLGSVSRHVIDRAACPVVVVKAPGN
ncbi:MAG: universal stress protein [Actinomycetota bacterium]